MCEHIALILDGNRRWGKKNRVSMAESYKRGGEALQNVVKELIELKIPIATMYGFSFENWNRSLYEISVIMVSFMAFLEEHRNFFMEYNIKVKFIGELNLFEGRIVALLMELEYLTRNNSSILVQLAVSYSGRNEILNAAALSKESGTSFEECLYTHGVVVPDLLIRTGGCKRLSNFLLWQLAYTELFFLDKLWPDFDKADLHTILDEYKKNTRNNGV